MYIKMYIYITFASSKVNKAEPTLALKEETSQKIQNRGTSGPKKGHVSAKNFFKKNFADS